MDSLFEPDFLDSTPSFLSFSSFADLDNIFTSLDTAKSPAWNSFGFTDTKSHSDTSSSDTSSPDLGWRFPSGVIESAFTFEDPPTPAGTGDFGIFLAGPSTYSQPTSFAHRSTGSTESWGVPQTPDLKGKESSDSLYINQKQYSLPTPPTPASYSWDEASLNPPSSSSTHSSPFTTAPHRTTSNPTLSTRPRQPVKPVMSMPALREEDAAVPCTPSQWFDGTEVNAENPIEGVDDLLTGDFDWVFSDYGLGDAPPMDGSIFAAFQEPTSGSTESSIPVLAEPEPEVEQLPWLSLPVDDIWNFDQSHGYTIDPMAIMQPTADEELVRPSSAPKLQGLGVSGGLSVPMPAMMSKSHSSDGYNTRAPPRDLFTYAPQQLHSAPPQPPPLFTTVPAGSTFTSNNPNYPRAMPMTPTQSRRPSSNYNPQNLSIQIHQPNFSTYMPHTMPITPQSAEFGNLSMMQSQSQPIQMTRAGTQPLPTTRKLSSAGIDLSNKPNPPMPAHLLRAQAIVQMQEAKEEAQRVEMRRQAASRRVNMADASVMQPPNAPTQIIHPRPQPTIMGWEEPSAQSAVLPVLTTAPLVNVHPPPAQYYPSSHPSTTHRVHPHPPPHPGKPTTSRPIANLPQFSTPKRKPSTPSKKSPSGRKRATPGGGGFSWGETTFINFTSDDAEKLLTGVAPSGSQSKRKREDEMIGFLESSPMVEGDRSKRSRSDE